MLQAAQTLGCSDFVLATVQNCRGPYPLTAPLRWHRCRRQSTLEFQ